MKWNKYNKLTTKQKEEWNFRFNKHLNTDYIKWISIYILAFSVFQLVLTMNLIWYKDSPMQYQSLFEQYIWGFNMIKYSIVIISICFLLSACYYLWLKYKEDKWLKSIK